MHHHPPRADRQAMTLVQNVPDVAMVVDREWKIIELNQRAAAFIHQTNVQASGKSLWHVLPISLGTACEEYYQQALQTQSAVRFERWYPALKSWFQVTATPVSEGLVLFLQALPDHYEAERLAALVESSDDAIISQTLEGTIISWNRGAERLYGYRAEEVIGHSIAMLLPPECADELPRLLALLQQGQRVEHYETERVCQDGSRKTVSITFSPIRDAANHLLGASAIARDLTAQKRAEAILRSSEQLKQAILDSLTAHIVVLDSSGTIIAVNEAWQRFARENSKPATLSRTGIGVNYLEICRKTNDAFAPGSQEALAGLLSILQGSLPHFTLEYPCHSPTEKRWFLMSATPLLAGEGAVVIHHDITERKRAEEAIQASEVRSRRLLEANLIGVVVADEQYILEANDTFLKMVGYTREDLTRRRLNWSDMTPVEYAPFDQRGLQELAERGVCTPFEKEFYRKDGSRVPILIGATTLQEQPVQWICFILDISERKERERKKDEFISMASHELKTPITSLKGFAQLIQRRLEQRGMDDLAHYLARMQTQLNTLTKLVNDLLDVSKIQAGRLDYASEKIDLDALVCEVVEFLQQTTSTHTIRLSGTSSHAHVLGDRDRLAQVFTNLLTNAIKYSPQAKEVDVQIALAADSVTVSVRDYGVGIAPAHQSKIFERFYRVQADSDKAFPGLGMGLYISQQIVERLGGALRVASEKGHGATFSVVLPLDAESPAETERV